MTAVRLHTNANVLSGPMGPASRPGAPRPALVQPVKARQIKPDAVMAGVAVLDWALVCAGVYVASVLALPEGLLDSPTAAVLALFAVLGCLKIGLWMTSAYTIGVADTHAERALGGLALGVVGAMGLTAVVAPSPHSAGVLALVAPLTGLVLAGAHAIAAQLLHRWANAGALAETTVIVGATDAARRLLQRNRSNRQFNVVAVFDDRLSRAPAMLEGVPVVGSLEDLLSWPHLPEVDRIVVTVSPSAEERVRALIERLRIVPNRLMVMVDLAHIGADTDQLVSSADGPLACISGPALDERRSLLKRVMDLSLGGLLVLAFAPVMALVALALRIEGKGPVLFAQDRHGFNNKIIKVWKFRSMVTDANPHGQLHQTKVNDPRVTKLGAFLRKTSLDELPQLWNVLVGDMALVGPRPHAIGMKTAGLDSQHIVAEYAHRHRMKPGLTGWAQIHGSRGPLFTEAAVRERVRLDLEYIEQANIWLDLWILLRTGPSLFGDKTCAR